MRPFHFFFSLEALHHGAGGNLAAYQQPWPRGGWWQRACMREWHLPGLLGISCDGGTRFSGVQVNADREKAGHCGSQLGAAGPPEPV